MRLCILFFFQAEDGIRDLVRSRGLGDVYKRQGQVQQVREFSSGGLAGVWAAENTREAIYGAMLRRDTFGTSGPQIKVRFFGGWAFSAADVSSADFVTRGYAGGVPMGGTLPAPAVKGSAEAVAPSFRVWASKAADSGNLDRIQVVKGWLDAAGSQQEQIYDVAWSGERQLDARSQLPAVGNTVHGLYAQPTDGQTLTVNGNTITFKSGSAPAAAAVPAGSGVSGNLVTDGRNTTVYLGDTTTPLATVADLAKAIDLASGVNKALISAGAATISNTSGTDGAVAGGLAETKVSPSGNSTHSVAPGAATPP